MTRENFISVQKKGSEYTFIIGSPNSSERYNRELINVSLNEFLEALMEIPRDFYTSSLKINFDPESRFDPLEEERIEGIVNSAKKQKMCDEDIKGKIFNLRFVNVY